MLGKFDNQGDTKWIVIRGLLRVHNDTPFGRLTPAALRAYLVVFSYYVSISNTIEPA
jgi:hypothetical protein